MDHRETDRKQSFKTLHTQTAWSRQMTLGKRNESISLSQKRQSETELSRHVRRHHTPDDVTRVEATHITTP